MQYINFESYIFSNGTISACYLNTTLGVPCQQGNVPVIGVDALSASDIQAAVRFSAEHNLRLVVKNTGHDLLGRSTARGSFMIWTHHMKNITYNSSFVPEGALASEKYDAITLGAGVQWHEAYGAAQAHGRVLVGGTSDGGSVGAAGGWILGGGHSIIAPQYGLGVDNVIQFTLVTSNGQHITANSYTHPNLFWALRGGGGGTFGVTTSVTYRTHPIIPLSAVFFACNSTNNETLRKAFTEYVRITPALSDAGWGGYGSSDANQFSFVFFSNLTLAQANTSVEPFFSFVQDLTSEGLVIAYNTTTSYESFYAAYADLFPNGNATGDIGELGSRLLTRDAFETDYEKMAEVLLGLNGGVNWSFVAGGAVSKVDPDSTGLNPAWRRALVHAIVAQGWDEGTPASEIEQFRNKLRQDEASLIQLVPESGAYFNEASLYEPDPQYTFFGSHYDNLKTIKGLYDPIGLFVVAEGVGSEDWDKELKCRLA